MVVAIILIIHTQLFFPDVFKNINDKLFNLMSRTNERRHIEWHGTCKFICRIDVIGNLFRIQVIMNVNVVNHVT